MKKVGLACVVLLGLSLLVSGTVMAQGPIAQRVMAAAQPGPIAQRVMAAAQPVIGAVSPVVIGGAIKGLTGTIAGGAAGAAAGGLVGGVVGGLLGIIDVGPIILTVPTHALAGAAAGAAAGGLAGAGIGATWATATAGTGLL
jgi:hypothetical protein